MKLKEKLHKKNEFRIILKDLQLWIPSPGYYCGTRGWPRRHPVWRRLPLPPGSVGRPHGLRLPNRLLLPCGLWPACGLPQRWDRRISNVLFQITIYSSKQNSFWKHKFQEYHVLYSKLCIVLLYGMKKQKEFTWHPQILHQWIRLSLTIQFLQRN